MTTSEHEFLGQLFVALVGVFSVVLPLKWWLHNRRVGEESGIPPKLPDALWTREFPNRLDLVGVGFFLMLFALMWASAGAGGGEAPVLGRGLVLVNAVLFLLLAAVVPALVYWRVGLNEFFGLKWPHWRWIVLIAPSFVAVMILGSAALMHFSGWQAWVEGQFQGDQQAVVKLLQETDDMILLALLGFSAVIIAPLAEEVIFRGYIFRVLRDWSGLWPAAIFSGLLFGVIHMNVLGLPVLAGLGVVLALLYEKTRTIWVPIACHAAFNGFQICLALMIKFEVIELPS